MKKGLVLLVFAMLASSVTLFAQENDNVKKYRATKEDRIEMMAKRVSSTLMLNDSQRDKFTPLYKKYIEEINSLSQSKREKVDKIDDAKRDKIIKDNFARQRKMIDVKEKYYNKFSKFLSPAQAKKAIDSLNGNFYGKVPQKRGVMKYGSTKKFDNKDDRVEKRDNKK